MGLELFADSIIKSTVYVAGPMRGYKNNNHDEFDRVEKELISTKMYYVINPARLDRDAGVDSANDMTKLELREALRRDFNAIFECDAMYMMHGWEKSEGARAEHALASALEMRIMYQ